MQQTSYTANRRLGARFTATDTRGHFGRGPDAPAPGGRVGRGEMRFGVRSGGALAPRKRSGGPFSAPNARQRFGAQGIDAADYLCSRQGVGCEFHRDRTDGALGARP